MYRINRTDNRIEALSRKSFKDLCFYERQHFQEWIAHEPKCLGEDLLIVQKEFSGFDDTNERLDLLALDKQGSLVIVENKLDDAGRDVTWQALKYASYCSGLTRENVRDMYVEFASLAPEEAEQKISAFLEVGDFDEVAVNKGLTQRIILVAGHFRKEVTSTVMWLMGFNIRLQCFTAEIYAKDDDVFISIDQIIPTRGAEEFMIGIAKKNQAEAAAAEAETGRHAIRKRFWKQLLPAMGEKTDTFQSISPGRFSWLGTSTGQPGLKWIICALGSCTRVELYIDTEDAQKNLAVFHALEAHRTKIEADFGEILMWEPLEVARSCRIKHEAPGDVFDSDRWLEMNESLIDRMVRFKIALSPHLSSAYATPVAL